MVLQAPQLVQEDARALVKRSPGLGQRDAIPAAIQQAQPQLSFEIFDGRRDRRLRPEELFGGRLEAALGDHGVEAEELVDREAVQHPILLWC
jgi:hypothetical protein